LTQVSLVKKQGGGKAVFLSGSSKEESMFWPFLASRSCLHSLAHGPLTSSKPAMAA